jgi:hypothetical protein
MHLMCIVQVDRPTFLRLAAEADSDPRSVARELAAAFGEGTLHVRGRAGERIRAVLQAHSLIQAQSPPDRRRAGGTRRSTTS